MNNFESSFDENDDELFNAYQDSSVDLKFRSIQVQSHTGGDFFPSYHNQHASYGLQHDIHYVKPDITKSSSEAVTNGCPCAPFGIAKNNFKICNSDCVSVVQKVTANLSNHLNYDFSYIDGEFMWKGKYLCGSSSFDLEVNLYHDKPTAAYTVAVRKVSCDCSINACFTTFFNLMKTALCTDTADCAKPVRKPFCIPKSCGWASQVSDEEFLEGVQPIFRMAACSLESRIQSVKMLCDVAQKDAHYLELPAFQPQCVQLLCELVMDETDDVRQHAVMAIAALAELDSYREAFIHSSVLPELFCLVENCQYETAQMRRTAAATLAVFSRTHPYTVRCELQHQHQFNLTSWLQHASCLLDVRTRESALIVKTYLEDVSIADCSAVAGGCGDIDSDCLISEDDAAAYLPIIH